MSEQYTPSRKKWSSGTVGLLIFGSVIGGLILTSPKSPPVSNAAQGSSSDWDEPVRNQYATREDCVRDYSEEECRQGSASSGGGIFFFGPWYRSNWRSYSGPADAGPGRSARSSPTGALPANASVVRGGFGSSARAYGGSYRGGG